MGLGEGREEGRERNAGRTRESSHRGRVGESSEDLLNCRRRMKKENERVKGLV